MRPIATLLTAALVVLLAAPAALAQQCDVTQTVTVRQVNTVPQANLDALTALGANATAEDIHTALTNQFDNPRRPDGAPFICVQIEAVVLSDPRYSGLASLGANNIPNRVHLYVRDVAAATDGVEGMTIQIVDDTQSGATLPLRVGDIIELTGFLNIFGNPPDRVWQLQPLDGDAITIVGDVPPGDPILDPVVVSSSDINTVVEFVAGEPLVQANWSNYNSLTGQYVRLEGAQVTNSDQNPGLNRPNWAIATLGQDARVGGFDLSLRYRNDRDGVYPNPPFFTRPADDPWIVPPPGAVVDVQGFLTMGQFDAFNMGLPARAFHRIQPITDDDFVISESPPIINLQAMTTVPDGPFTVTASVLSGSGAPLSVVELNYEFSGGGSGTIGMTPAGDDMFEATVPVTGDQDGEFVSYSVFAETSDGLENTSSTFTTRVLFDGITQISHIQQTPSGGFGPSPFAGMTLPMDLDVVVMTDVSVSGIITIQDGTEPWSGVHVFRSAELEALLEEGMTLNITSATIEESFNMTRLNIPTGGYTITGTADTYPAVVLSTADVATSNTREPYEGMMLRFENVTITSDNPDAPSNFGEWAFSSDGTAANALRGDDESFAIPFGSDMFDVGDEVEFIQGVLAFTFSNYKLWPLTMDDIGKITVSTDDGGTSLTTAINSVFPNPVVRSATLEFTLATDGHVTMEVFDVTGRRVATLVDGMRAAGPQQVSLEAGSLASGMYIVRLASGNTVESTRFVVTR